MGTRVSSPPVALIRGYSMELPPSPALSSTQWPASLLILRTGRVLEAGGSPSSPPYFPCLSLNVATAFPAHSLISEVSGNLRKGKHGFPEKCIALSLHLTYHHVLSTNCKLGLLGSVYNIGFPPKVSVWWPDRLGSICCQSSWPS